MVFFAIDGVAPRAKINQQRSRRFRTGKEILESMHLKRDVAQDLLKKGMTVPESLITNTRWDSNVITPGTDFMDNVSDFIKNYIVNLLANNSKFKHLKILFSDSSVPKEGEHKILEFIRLQRVQKNYNANISHCIYGADADLIMLGLSTHEPHFYILRENISLPDHGPNRNRAMKLLNDKKKEAEAKNDIVTETMRRKSFKIKMCFVKVYILREYLGRFFKDVRIRFEWDIERFIDDFVLLCFFVGNDFLPHIPGLSIRKGGIDILLNYYRTKLPMLDNYITHRGEINLHILERYLDL